MQDFVMFLLGITSFLGVDTTSGTADDRFKIFVNGVEQEYATRSNPSQNLELYFNSNVEHKLGEEAVRDRYNFDGYMAEINFVDGTAHDASSFGEYHPTTGAWVPKSFSGSHGSNGYYLNFSMTQITLQELLAKTTAVIATTGRQTILVLVLGLIRILQKIRQRIIGVL